MRALSILACFLIASPVAGDEAKSPVTLAYPASIESLDELVRMSECQLLDLYRRAEPGPLPTGFAPGRMISNPGRRTTVPVSRFTKAFVWQGKYFDDGGIMTNKMFHFRFIKGEVQQGESWIDGRPSIIIDYSQTSLIFRPYRDELREISPGIYLGIMFKRDACKPKIVTYFAIDARCGSCR